MHIDKYKKEDGYYIPQADMPGKEGLFYEDAESVIQCEILGFCGCGCPDASVKYVGAALKLLSTRNDLTWEQWVEAEKGLLKTSEAAYFMWYFLDSKELTEHGGSVPGWLTDKGRELMEDIEELYKDEPIKE